MSLGPGDNANGTRSPGFFRHSASQSDKPTELPEMAWAVPWNLIGQTVSGDIGDLTIYTDRYGQKVAFPKAPPEKPPTFAQLWQRARFATAVRTWRELDEAARNLWEQMTLRLSLQMTGHNAWITCSFRHDEQLVETLRQQSGYPLTSPPPV